MLTFRPVSDAAAAKIKAAAGVRVGAPAKAVAAAAPIVAAVTKPGVERWPVKTGTDLDVSAVGTEVVKTTVEEMVSIPRPPDMQPATNDFPDFQEHRSSPVEDTVWQLDATIIALKQEADGDYHLVLQGASGETMIGEIPTPRPPFVQATSPFLANIVAARKAVDNKLVKKLKPAAFVPMRGKLVPREAIHGPLPAAAAAAPAPASFVTPEESAAAAFKTQVKPTRVRITGVGFFDRVHGQMGVSQLNGIELHPVLQIEWL